MTYVPTRGGTGRAYAQFYLPELLPAPEHAVASLAAMSIGLPLVPCDVHAHLVRSCRLFGMKGLLDTALGGLDMAPWYAWARAREEPLVRALGAKLRPLRAHRSVGLYSAHEVMAIAENTLAAGFAGPKIKVGFAVFAEDLATVRAAKRALGNSAALILDYNQSLTLPEAMARCKALDDEGLESIEEPVLADDLQGCARIAAALTTPIQIAENFHGASELRAAIAVRASDLVMPDVQFIHGVIDWLEASALSQAAGLPLSSHTFVEASAQLLCATPTAHWIEVLDAAGGPRQAPLQIKRGMLLPRDTPGIGLAWREDQVFRHRA